MSYLIEQSWKQSIIIVRRYYVTTFLLLVLLAWFSNIDGRVTALGKSLTTDSTPNQIDQDYDCSQAQGIRIDDCEVLVTFYNATEGYRWNSYYGWLNSNQPCNWPGVVCTGDRVSSLAFVHAGTRGEIPPELGQLSELTSLYIGRSSISGSIPPELGQLTNLTELHLDQNRLTGEIPPELGQLTKLTKLELFTNDLSGEIPAELGQLTNLTSLWLSGNNLSGEIPTEFGQLTNLRKLELQYNELSGEIPAELGQLTGLVDLYLSDNQLSGPVPPELGQLLGLKKFYLKNNQLSGMIPAELEQLKNLQQLRLASNQFHGPISETLVCSMSADTINLEYNKLSGATSKAAECLTGRYFDSLGTQTVPPINLQAVSESPTSIRLSWDPIQYTQHGGYYEIGLSEDGDTLYERVTTTASKSESSILIEDLSSESAYTFVVRTFTPAHEEQQSALTSECSDSVSATTLPPGTSPMPSPTSANNVYLPTIFGTSGDDASQVIQCE